MGVDVFFVISGYLITTIILRECAEERFSILKFYERRARRILPALFLVMACSLPFAWWILFPKHFVDYGESLAATSLFSSNILFWQERGYFDTAAELKPLLHTWSLAVEEQFYIFFPIGVLIIWRFGLKSIFGLIALAALISFIFSDFISTRNIAANFFLLPSRAWELLIGSLAAIWLMKRTPPAGKLASAGALLGLGLIAAAVVYLDENTPFPGRAALLPVLGSLLVIVCARPTNFAGKLLGLKPMVAIGLISYSVYLWHQPIFALTRHASLNPPSHELMALLSVVSVGLAWASWQYVEAPFRDPARVSRGQIFTASATGIAIFAAVGISIPLGNGFYSRFDTATQQLLLTAEEDGRGRDGCIRVEDLPNNGCSFNPQLLQRAFLWGDSHAMAIAESLAADLSSRGISLEVATESGCASIPNFARADRDCPRFNRAVIDYLGREDSPKVVILHSRWATAFETTPFDNGEGGAEHSIPRIHHASRRPQSATQTEWITAELRILIQELLDLDKSIVIVAGVPEAGWNVASYLAKRRIMNIENETPLSVSADRVHARNVSFETAISSFRQSPQIRIVNPEKVFCDTFLRRRCALQREEKALYRDGNHLSLYGASLVTPEIAEAANQLVESATGTGCTVDCITSDTAN